MRTVVVGELDKLFSCAQGHTATFTPAGGPRSHIGNLHCCDCRSNERVKIVFANNEETE